MYIECAKDNVCVGAGEFLHGSINVKQEVAQFATTKLELILTGYERTFAQPRGLRAPGSRRTGLSGGGLAGWDLNAPYLKSEDMICKQKYTMMNFKDGYTPKGMYKFPFQLEIPANIPASLCMSHKKDEFV